MSNDLNKLFTGALIGTSLLGGAGAKVETPADLQAEGPPSYSQTIPPCEDPYTIKEKEPEPADPRETINKEGDIGDSAEADLRRNNEASSNIDTANSANQEQLGAAPDPPDTSYPEISAYPDVSPESKVNTVQDLGNYGKENLVGDYGQNDIQPSSPSETPTISDTQGDLAGDYGQNGSPSDSSSAGSESSGASDSGGSSGSSETST